MIKDTMGRINQVGIISVISLCELNSPKYRAAAITASTVAWLVDCGMP